MNFNLKLKNLLFPSYFVYLFIKTYLFSRNTSFLFLYKNEWAFSESLINYSGGFVRRGLFGEILSFFSIEPLNYPLYSFLIYLISLFHIFIFIFKKIKSHPISNQLVYIFIPFGFFYFLNNLNFFIGRRDFLIINLLIFVQYIYEKGITRRNLYVYFALSLITSLIYEVILFFIPLLWLIHKKNTSLFSKTTKSYLFFLVVVNLLLLLRFSTPANYSLLCENVNSLRVILNLKNKGCWGAPSYLKTNNPSQQIYDIFEGLQLTGLGFWLLIVVLLILFLRYFVNLDFYYVLGILPLFLLFFIAQDYGRWLFLIFLTSLILSIENQDNEKLKFKLLVVLTILVFGYFVKVPIYLFQEVQLFRAL